MFWLPYTSFQRGKLLSHLIASVDSVLYHKREFTIISRKKLVAVILMTYTGVRYSLFYYLLLVVFIVEISSCVAFLPFNYPSFIVTGRNSQ